MYNTLLLISYNYERRIRVPFSYVCVCIGRVGVARKRGELCELVTPRGAARLSRQLRAAAVSPTLMSYY